MKKLIVKLTHLDRLGSICIFHSFVVSTFYPSSICSNIINLLINESHNGLSQLLLLDLQYICVRMPRTKGIVRHTLLGYIFE